MELTPPPIPERRKKPVPFGIILGYFGTVVALLIMNAACEYRLIRLDARVNKLMTSGSSVTIDQVRSALSDVIQGEEVIYPENRGYTGISVHFGNKGMRALYLEFNLQSGVVTQWGMSKGASDTVDTAIALDEGLSRRLIKRVALLTAITILPVPLLWIRSRIVTRPIKLIANVACAFLFVASAGVGLTEIARLLVYALVSLEGSL